MKHLFDTDEIQDLITSFVAITISLILFNVNGIFGVFDLTLRQIAVLGVIISLSVGIGFVFHELAHKFVAMYYGHYAKFQTFTLGIIAMLVMSLFPIGILFLAPGAVVIYAHNIRKDHNGIISIAGPLTNIIIALMFLFLYYSSMDIIIGALLGINSSLIKNFFDYGKFINLLLALFNMIPFAILDGAKVFAWNKIIWLGTVIIIILLFMV
ncbi:MAG: site-2 protease family protein [Candidatus Micrarchaeota archaeon]|nr:site-2 protease family protein [Candidatus Micrarchaeota archaeon]